MMFISGQSGCGKTNLCNILAVQAAKLGMSVIIIGKHISIVDLCPKEKEYVLSESKSPIPWNEIDQCGQITKVTASAQGDIHTDDILNSFLNDYKFVHEKQDENEKRYTLLILDEASEFSWNEISPLRELLRKGRKYGITGVLSTQYLNSDTASNINNALEQCTSFCCFNEATLPKNLSKKYPELNEYIHNLGKYEAFIVGNFTVNNIPIGKPLRFKTSKH